MQNLSFKWIAGQLLALTTEAVSSAVGAKTNVNNIWLADASHPCPVPAATTFPRH